MAFNKNQHLDCVLKSLRIRNEENLLNKHIDKATEIKEALKNEYTTNMYEPFNSGSYAKNTAINLKFDFDLIAPFKRNAFDTLEKMYDKVHDMLYAKYKDVATIRRQKVSIGLEFFRDKDGDVIKVDVVPGRELNQDQYQDDNKLNLYVNDQFGKIQKGSERLQSNIRAQIDNIKTHVEKGNLRRVIRLLKNWRVAHNKKPKSFFLELITDKAFDSKTIEGNTWDILKEVLEFIRDEVKTISLPDPGNSNNDVADILDDYDKSNLSSDMKNILERIEENEENLKMYFPVNSKFPCEEEKHTYGEKEKTYSKPPSTVRFG